MDNFEAFIEINPKIMMGKPVIKGTRITVELILEHLAGGASMENILEYYPSLTRDAIAAALLFAAETLRSKYFHPIAS